MLLTDARFDIPRDIPFAPGTSPFRQKGLVYRGNHDFMNKHVPGGLPAIRRTLESPGLVRFFEQRFAAWDWHDALPNMYLQDAAARMRGISLVEQARDIGVYHARERLKGFSNLLIRALSTESVALWVPRVPAVYYTFGKFRTEIAGLRRVSFSVAGVPVMVARWLGAVFAATGGEMISLGGAREVHVEFPRAELGGEAHGIPLCTILGEVTWK